MKVAQVAGRSHPTEVSAARRPIPIGQLRWQDAALRVTSAMLAGGDAKDLLHVTAEAARELVNGDLATLALPREDGRSLELRAAVGYHGDDLRGSVFPRAESLSGRVLAAREPMLIADATRSPNAYQPICELGDMGATIIVPLEARGHPFGTLLVARRHGREPFDEDLLDLLTVMADHVAVAIEYARAQEQLRRLAVVEERERIARELHDTVIQRLFATGLRLQALAAGDDDGWRDRVEEIAGDMNAILGDIRTTIFDDAAEDG